MMKRCKWPDMNIASGNSCVALVRIFSSRSSQTIYSAFRPGKAPKQQAELTRVSAPRNTALNTVITDPLRALNNLPSSSLAKNKTKTYI